jgi:ABC-type nickel/cobalt efflux system permease component RcnA
MTQHSTETCHQQPEDGLKMPLFACKTNTTAAAAGCLPTTLSSPILEPINDVLLPCMHCCACNTLNQQMPAQKQQHSKNHMQQHSKTTAEHKQQPHTHTRGMQPQLPAAHCSQKEGLLIYCCGCDCG